ncbi:MAG: ABC transporter ATP-binding protein [Nitrososphaerota archaeon]|jgi:ABC-2 type transport system ATP-binding protein|nr:ABC transporter ATP-binding protein [Nitrososphaerota archaeon]
MAEQELCDLEVRDLSRTFGNTYALKKVSFKILQGEKFALLGPNGAGKSTTLKLLTGLLKPTSGEIKIGGVDPSTKKARTIMGYLPEDASPYQMLSVRENLEYIGALREIENVKETTDHLLDFFDLNEYERSKVGKLSRGTTQKLALALAIIHKPKILLLDEPLNYLDIPTQEKVITRLNSLDVTVIVSTHIMSVASRLTKNVIMLARGVIRWEGSIDALRALGEAEEPIESIVARMMTSAP